MKIFFICLVSGKSWVLHVCMLLNELHFFFFIIYFLSSCNPVTRSLKLVCGPTFFQIVAMNLHLVTQIYGIEKL